MADNPAPQSAERSQQRTSTPADPGSTPSRRSVLRGGAIGGAVLLSLRAVLGDGSAPAVANPAPSRAIKAAAAQAGAPDVPATPATPSALTAAAGSSARSWDFSQRWLFGGIHVTGAEQPGYDDSGFTEVTVPHTVTPLSWGGWDPARWEHVWIYRKHFPGAALSGGRVFADFDGVLANATVVLNGATVATHEGGYLPFSAELTGHVVPGDNVIAVIVDARWLNVPPDNPPGGPASVDYLQPGGIYRDVRVRVVPDVFISDVWAKPVAVLSDAGRGLQIEVSLDAVTAAREPFGISSELLDADRPVGAVAGSIRIGAAGTTVASLTLTGLANVSLWSPDAPKLYTLRTTVSQPGSPSHTLDITTGFREVRFELDGLYLNGERLQIFGLNRHQLYPYVGMAASARLQRRDAEILKNELNVNMVRCSHYPQSPHFLDACDELGLLVWQETPGWQYVGDASYQRIVRQNVRDMVIRDRNRPSVIMWGTRLNETPNYTGLYEQTRRLAHQLDGTRPATGSMASYSLTGWAEDVFGYDDYHSSDGTATLEPPLPAVPYLVSEAVGALDGAPRYRWTDTGAVLALQGRLHAQVHNAAQGNRRIAGLLGWCAFDYASLNGDDRVWANLKTPGVLDTFRVPKPGAAFYRSQVPAAAHPVILPMFFWDFGPDSPATGPGDGAIIASNCDRLELFIGGNFVASTTPDIDGYGNLACPLAFADLTVDAASRPELRIDGYVNNRKVTSLRMSADPSRDRLALTADHTSLVADGSDMTRLTFRALDAYGNQRPYVSGDVTLSIAGPATLIGENPFPFGRYGGVGGALARSLPGRTGLVTVTARHPALGHATARLTVGPALGMPFL